MTDAELITNFINAYALTDKDTETLASAITTARLASMQEAYRHAQRIVGIDATWKPPQNVQDRVARLAHKDAQSIAETYTGLLRSFLEQLLHVTKGWSDLFGSVCDAVAQMVSDIGEWLSGFLPWKSSQIVTTTCGAGLNDGTMEFMDDIEEVLDESDESDVDLSQIRSVDDIGVMIVPSHSSSDFCSEYAGNTYSMEDYLSLGIEWPAHTSCIHYPVIVAL